MHPHLRRFAALGGALAIITAACVGGPATGVIVAPEPAVAPLGPSVPAGPIDPELLDDLFWIATPIGEILDLEAVRRVGRSGDPRAAWVVADILRFIQVGPHGVALAESLAELTGLELDPFAPLAWVEATNRLLEWDTPAPADFRLIKQELYTQVAGSWDGFFGDADAEVDWRLVSFGGVQPDLRPLDDLSACAGCIPALDHPAVTDAAGGDWLQDQRIVFGVVINGEARAYPRNMLETHELVNDTLGGVEIALPYCTLCGSAQAFLAGEGDDRRVMRTSGLLQRSNKIMFDLVTGTYYDTFAGRAIAGPLQGEELEEVTVVTSTWGAWKEAHPETTILAEDGGIGRTYEEDPLGGANLDGPIFPVGAVDGRLSPEVQVLGVRVGDVSYAFPVRETAEALEAGERVEVDGVSVLLDGSGLIAFLEGEPLVTSQAFWFAWSQFNPGTLLWQPVLAP